MNDIEFICVINIKIVLLFQIWNIDIVDPIRVFKTTMEEPPRISCINFFASGLDLYIIGVLRDNVIKVRDLISLLYVCVVITIQFLTV